MAPKRPRVSESQYYTNDDEEVLSSSSRWICETVKACHVFKVEGYSLAKGIGVGEYMTSAEFSVGGHDWAIVFYPDGLTEAAQDYIAVYLKLVSPGEVRATLEFKLLDQTGKGKHGIQYFTRSPKTFTNNCFKGWPKYMKRSKLETSSYLRDDCLSIHCTVGVWKTRVEEEKHYVIPVPPSDMSQKLKSLLESEIGSDITIQVGNEFFKAHKSILAARSPVFRAMFFGLAGNPDMETVAIEDVDPFVFKAMLLFLYSDEFPKARDLSDPDFVCTSTTITQHLLAAADRFDLARLKLMCEANLCEDITINNVATALVLADQHQCLQLKTACLNFAAKPENAGEVMKSDGFADLAESRPSLLIDLFETSAVVNKN
ncbi:hypothetical protein MKW98_027370 [Papaver atlanticum]|uniref:Uncharacterized protein n=1 Tax=Papaver atlanticum TaxID=357466 RepID=A0AAD4XUC8_9MAGN|nr:hypothetical protein MKW98_027370 [Papaver atlanticum]